jgi:cysteinyl-tRNA synthetase
MAYVDELRRKCYEAMNDDLNSPIVISHLFDACRVINTVVDQKATMAGDVLAALTEVFHTFAFDILGLKKRREAEADVKKLSAKWWICFWNSV